ncbi:MAG: hypothetical protein AMS15_09170 [Planctomycetes bacterium DG_23]|nr:MAG: hypothetical protein AMS15_09170 [Planctomycetes bacterium DG_23]
MKGKRRKSLVLILIIITGSLIFATSLFAFFVSMPEKYAARLPGPLFRIQRVCNGQYIKIRYRRKLRNSEAKERRSALVVLTNREGNYAFKPDYVSCLRLLQSDPEGDVRAHAGVLLGLLLDDPKYGGLHKEEIEVIVDGLGKALSTDSYWKVRDIAALNLARVSERGSFGAPKALKFLKEVAADESLPGSETARTELDSIRKSSQSQEEQISKQQ